MSKKSYLQVYWPLSPGGHSVNRERSMIHLYRTGLVGVDLTGARTLCGEPIPRNIRQTRAKIKGGVFCDHCRSKRTARPNPLQHPQAGAWQPNREEIVAEIALYLRAGGQIKQLPSMQGSRANEVTCTQYHGAPVGFQEYALE